MKCLKNMESGKIVRMSDSKAKTLTESNPDKWIFASKKDWKSQAKNIGERKKFYIKG